MNNFYFPGFDEFDLDDEEQSLCQYFLRLQCIFEKAQDEFEYVFTTWEKIERIRKAIGDEYAAMAKDGQDQMIANLQAPASPGEPIRLEVPLIYMPALGAAEIREQSALLKAESSAGSLILMMDDAIQRLRHSILSPETKTPYPTDFTLGRIARKEGVAVATAVYAAGNAYRHAKDWDGLVNEAGHLNEKHRNYKESRRTLAILETLVGFKPIADGCVCVETLRVISLDHNGKPGIGILWDGSMTDIGLQFAEEYCEREDAYSRVEEALRHHHDYNNFELSHSGNSDLYSDEEHE